MSELIVVGTGIRSISQITREAEGWIKAADFVHYLVADPITEQFVQRLNQHSASLAHCYVDKRKRSISYEEMIDCVLTSLNSYKLVCLALYGHPGIFVYPSHEAIRRARSVGHRAEMLPGISAEDCLFADIGFDPARSGCCSYEATDFLLYNRVFDVRSYLVLWQVGLIGDVTFKRNDYDNPNVGILVDVLSKSFSKDHNVFIYEAAQFHVCSSRIQQVPIGYLPTVNLTAISTLVVPPAAQSRVDMSVAETLGIREFITQTSI